MSEGGGGILAAYHRLVRYGSLHPDGSQVAAVQALHLLQGVLSAQVTEEERSGGHLPGGQRSFIQGAYMWGPPGRGKTMIMELFSRTLPPYVTVRHHTLHWLLDHVYRGCWELQQAQPREVVRTLLGQKVYRYATPEEDPFDVVARDLAASCHLLCIDKVEVSDAADAATLCRLFEALLGHGCWVAFMSNRPLHKMFGSRVERDYMQEGGFVHLCNTHLLQLNVSGGPNYYVSAPTSPAAAAAAPAVHPLLFPRQPVSELPPAAVATVAASAALSRCYVGPEGAGRLRGSWAELVEEAGGREVSTTVTLKFFGRDKLIVPKALVVDDGPSASQDHGQDHPREQQPSALPPCGQDQEILAAYFEFDWLLGGKGKLRPDGPLGQPQQQQEQQQQPPPSQSGIGLVGGVGSGTLTAMDCLALAESGCKAVFVEGVPQFGPDARDLGIRFLMLVDVLYDHGIELHMSSEAPPEELFQPLLRATLEKGTSASAGTSNRFFSAAAAPEQQAAGAGKRQAEGAALLAEELLLYQRAAWRLVEMTRVPQQFCSAAPGLRPGCGGGGGGTAGNGAAAAAAAAGI